VSELSNIFNRGTEEDEEAEEKEAVGAEKAGKCNGTSTCHFIHTI